MMTNVCTCVYWGIRSVCIRVKEACCMDYLAQDVSKDS